MISTLTRPMSLLAAGAALLTALTAMPAHAALKHRYTFNGNANDSVGTANATVVDAGAPTAVFTSAGQLDLSANGGQGSGDNGGTGPANDAYVDLPNLIIQEAARSGTSGAISLEYWFTVSTQRTWGWIGGFAGPMPAGGSEGLVNFGNVNYILVTPSSGRLNQGIEISNNKGDFEAANPVNGGLGENTFGLGGPAAPAVPINVQHHVVAVWDKNETATNPGGTQHLYFNGVEILPGGTDVGGTNAIREDFDLNNLADEDNWLGRSQWGDPIFDGLFNEFNIYDHPLTQAEVTANFNGGPVAVPLPTLIVNTTTGAAAIKNLAAGPIAIDYYEIASTAGRLNQATWNSLSDQNFDAGLPADFNNSGGAVDGADLTTWKNGYATNANGDADGDGDTDGRDFLTWQQSVGKTPGDGDSWDEAGGNSDNLLVELYLNSVTTLSSMQQVNIGSPFRTGGPQDLTFRFHIAGEGGLTQGLVQYVTSGPSTAVPEPMAASLALVALVAGAALKRRGC